MNTFLSSIPILVVLVLMLSLKWPVAKAGLTALALALVLAVTVFGYGRAVYGDIGAVAAVSGALADAALTAATILWIIVPALCLYQFQMARPTACNSASGTTCHDSRPLACICCRSCISPPCTVRRIRLYWRPGELFG